MKEKILVIDDDTDICLLLKKYLSKNGYEVELAYNGKSALSYIENNQVDLALCDFRLPDMDGTEALKSIKSIRPETKVIIITGYSDVKTAVQCIKMGAVEYVTKPIFHEEILHAIKKALITKQEFTEESAPISKKSKPLKKKSSLNINREFVTGTSAQSKRIEQLTNLLAPTDMSVVIQGESGTGKEFIAKSIHQKSKRSDFPFVAIDCGALPKELAASELFGHIKGSFTGAINNKIGHFEFANGGTIFLDEIGNLSYDNQVKLLRVLQERKVRKIGDNKDFDIDVRIIAASNEDLTAAAKDGKFREDLFYRLNEFMVDLSPLRERKEDIEVYAKHFLNIANEELEKSIKGFDKTALQKIKNYYWHGNLRELKNVIKRAVLLSSGEFIEENSLPVEIISPTYDFAPESNDENETYSDLKSVAEAAERKAIIKVLEQVGYNKTKAANVLQIDRKTLYNKMESYDIDLKN
jgi:two-component system response regulator HydG